MQLSIHLQLTGGAGHLAEAQRRSRQFHTVDEAAGREVDCALIRGQRLLQHGQIRDMLLEAPCGVVGYSTDVLACRSAVSVKGAA